MTFPGSANNPVRRSEGRNDTGSLNISRVIRPLAVLLGLLLTSSVPALQRGKLSASSASAAPQADAGDLYVANIGSNQVTVLADEGLARPENITIRPR